MMCDAALRSAFISLFVPVCGWSVFMCDLTVTRLISTKLGFREGAAWWLCWDRRIKASALQRLASLLTHGHHVPMRAYSEDLRRKIVEAPSSEEWLKARPPAPSA